MGGVTLRHKVYDAICAGLRTNQVIARQLGVHVRQAEHATRTLADIGIICRPRANVGRRVAEWVPTGKAYQEVPRRPSTRPKRIRAKPDPQRVPRGTIAADDLQACMKKWNGPFAEYIAWLDGNEVDREVKME